MIHQPPIPAAGRTAPAVETILEAMLDPMGDLPFIAPAIMPDGTRAMATCHPVARVSDPFPYLRRDGRLFLGERLAGVRVNLGDGWHAAEVEPDVIGRVVILHLREREEWRAIARPGAMIGDGEVS